MWGTLPLETVGQASAFLSTGFTNSQKAHNLPY